LAGKGGGKTRKFPGGVAAQMGGPDTERRAPIPGTPRWEGDPGG